MTNTTWKDEEVEIGFLAKINEKNKAEEAEELQKSKAQKLKDEKREEMLKKFKGQPPKAPVTAEQRDAPGQPPKNGTALSETEEKAFKFKKGETKFKLQNDEESIEEARRLAREKLEKLNQDNTPDEVRVSEKADKSERTDWAKIGAEKFKPKAKAEEGVVVKAEGVTQEQKASGKEGTVEKPKKKPELKEQIEEKEEQRQREKKQATPKVAPPPPQVAEKKPNIVQKNSKTTSTGVTAVTKNVFVRWDD